MREITTHGPASPQGSDFTERGVYRVASRAGAAFTVIARSGKALAIVNAVEEERQAQAGRILHALLDVLDPEPYPYPLRLVK